MIVETLIVSVAAVTIAGTWLGLRFVERNGEAPREKDDAEAVETMEHCIRTQDRQTLRALLLARPYALSTATRRRAIAWINDNDVRIEAP